MAKLCNVAPVEHEGDETSTATKVATLVTSVSRVATPLTSEPWLAEVLNTVPPAAKRTLIKYADLHANRDQAAAEAAAKSDALQHCTSLSVQALQLLENDEMPENYLLLKELVPEFRSMFVGAFARNLTEEVGDLALLVEEMAKCEMPAPIQALVKKARDSQKSGLGMDSAFKIGTKDRSVSTNELYQKLYNASVRFQRLFPQRTAATVKAPKADGWENTYAGLVRGRKRIGQTKAQRQEVLRARLHRMLVANRDNAPPSPALKKKRLQEALAVFQNVLAGRHTARQQFTMAMLVSEAALKAMQLGNTSGSEASKSKLAKCIDTTRALFNGAVQQSLGSSDKLAAPVREMISANLDTTRPEDTEFFNVCSKVGMHYQATHEQDRSPNESVIENVVLFSEEDFKKLIRSNVNVFRTLSKTYETTTNTQKTIPLKKDSLIGRIVSTWIEAAKTIWDAKESQSASNIASSLSAIVDSVIEQSALSSY